MTYVAFFRNLNQGQRASPTAAALVEAFERAGALDVSAFQSNGTVAFTAPDAAGCVAQVVDTLSAESPWRDVALVQSVDWVRARVEEIRLDLSVDISRVELSLFSDSISPHRLLPIAGKRCTVLRGGPGFAVTLNEQPEESNATPTLERVLGVPVTSRGLPTLHRFLRRFDS